MRASIKSTVAGILTATGLALAPVGAATPASANTFHGGGGFQGGGFHGGGLHGGFAGGHFGGFGGRHFGAGFGRGYGGYGGYGGYRGYAGYGGYGGYPCNPYWVLVNPLMCL
jgi:hypothetical protein